MVVAVIRAATTDASELTRALISAGAGIVVTALICYAIWRSMRLPDQPDEIDSAGETFDPMAGGFPVPPLPGQVATRPSGSKPPTHKEMTDA